MFLRHRNGTAVGPLTSHALEVLWDAHIIDDTTPLSSDGETFTAAADFPKVIAHLRRTKSKLDHGSDPWPERIQVRAPVEVESAGPTTGPRSEASLFTTTALLFHHATERSRGTLTLRGSDGELALRFRDGKVVEVWGDGRFSLTRWLLEEAIVTLDQVQEAETHAPSMGGDIGAALVSAGTLAPGVYFEKLLAWATHQVGDALLTDFSARHFVPEDVPAPAIPLGFERFSLPLNALREVTNRGNLERRLLPKRDCPLIPSQVEGMVLEDAKPKPRELRALKAINGAKTLGDLLEEVGGSDERSRDVLRAVLFATEAGFVVFGDNPAEEREAEEVTRLDAEYEALEDLNLFERFGINQRATDEEVRHRRDELMKRLHPDRLGPAITKTLQDARQRVVSLVNETFEELKTSDQRYSYALALDSGTAGTVEEKAQLEAAQRAEIYFKKAEVLFRTKNYPGALVEVDAALDLSPKEPEFEIFRTYCHFLEQAREKGAREDAVTAIRKIRGLVHAHPTVARGYLYLGYLNKVVEKPDVATKYFRKVLEFEEDHPEASREVRLATLRKEKQEKKRRWGL